MVLLLVVVNRTFVSWKRKKKEAVKGKDLDVH